MLKNITKRSYILLLCVVPPSGGCCIGTYKVIRTRRTRTRLKPVVCVCVYYLILYVLSPVVTIDFLRVCVPICVSMREFPYMCVRVRVCPCVRAHYNNGRH